MGFGQVSSLSGGQRQRAQAPPWRSRTGAAARPPDHAARRHRGQPDGAAVVLDGTSYVVTSKSTYITGTGAATCVAGQTGTTADEVAVSSSVTWSNIGARPPVVVHSIVTPRWADRSCSARRRHDHGDHRKHRRGWARRHDGDAHRAHHHDSADHGQYGLRDLRRAHRRQLHAEPRTSDWVRRRERNTTIADRPRR